jgi:DNA-binding response OmpR family regulator
MSSSANIVIAREDLSIPGTVSDGPVSGRADALQARFFDLVSSGRPDVIVLDLRGARKTGSGAIRTIKRRTQIPIVVLCNREKSSVAEYRSAGAVDCVPAPVNILGLHQVIQRVLQLGDGRTEPSPTLPGNFAFAGIRFDPRRDLLAGKDSATVSLTRSESQMLAHLLSRPWSVCARGEIEELLYGLGNKVDHRAIYNVVTRLRQKLASAGGADAKRLIKTERRRGYSLLADVEASPQEVPALTGAPFAAKDTRPAAR